MKVTKFIFPLQSYFMVLVNIDTLWVIISIDTKFEFLEN